MIIDLFYFAVGNDLFVCFCLKSDKIISFIFLKKYLFCLFLILFSFNFTFIF